MTWKGIAELIALVSIVASLVFVGLQVRQTDAIARAELIVTAHAIEVEVDQAFMEYADLWVRGNAGEDLAATEMEIFRALVKHRNDSFFYSTTSAQALGIDDINGIVVNFASFLHQHPLARSVWLERERRLQRERRLVLPELPETNEWVTMVLGALGKIEAEGSGG